MAHTVLQLVSTHASLCWKTFQCSKQESLPVLTCARVLNCLVGISNPPLTYSVISVQNKSRDISTIGKRSDFVITFSSTLERNTIKLGIICDVIKIGAYNMGVYFVWVPIILGMLENPECSGTERNGTEWNRK